MDKGGNLQVTSTKVRQCHINNRVATITSQSTTDDLRQKRKKTREINVLRGLPASAPINISMDVRYNSTSLKNRQSTSQAVGTAIEWQTDKHEIVGFHMENKLCKLGTSLRNQGQNVSCPGHQGCTATIRVVDPISEYEIGRQIGVNFAQQQVGLKFAATDGDAKAFHGLQDAMPTVAAKWQADTTHLGQTQFRHIMRASFSSRMFPGENAMVRAENKKIFAEDVRTRC